MRMKGSSAVLEQRRERGVKLVEEGLSFNEAGRRLGCAASSVMRWYRALVRGGRKALKVKKSSGRPLKLGRGQWRRLRGILREGAEAHGFFTNLWTTARVADVIRKEFRVTYHPDHVGRLLHRLGLSCQKPELVARQADVVANQRWLEVDVPRIKKKPEG